MFAFHQEALKKILWNTFQAFELKVFNLHLADKGEQLAHTDGCQLSRAQIKVFLFAGLRAPKKANLPVYRF